MQQMRISGPVVEEDSSAKRMKTLDPVVAGASKVEKLSVASARRELALRFRGGRSRRPLADALIRIQHSYAL